MGDLPDAALRAAQRAALDRLDWSRLSPRLERFARSRGAPPEQAVDAAQSAVALVLEGKTSWDPAVQPDAERLLFATVRRILSNARLSARARREIPSDLLDDAPDPVTLDAPSAAAQAAHARDARAEAALSRLRDALAGDADALAVLALSLEGLDKPAEQAARLGVPAGRIYDVRDRIARQVKRLAREHAEGTMEEVAE